MMPEAYGRTPTGGFPRLDAQVPQGLDVDPGTQPIPRAIIESSIALENPCHTADDLDMKALISGRRLAAWALFVAPLVVGLVVFQHATRWRGGGNDHGDGPPLRLMSQAQSQRCLTARGLEVTSIGARSLHVTGASHLDVTLMFYPTYEQAQAVVARWWHDGQGPQLVSRTGARGGAMDSVTFRAVSELDDSSVRLLGGCVGRQPVHASA
jgi:hypothetical protein